MSAELKLDLAKLPKPTSIKLTAGYEQSYMTVCLGSIRSARAWATALGITLTDEDPQCRYITVRQESGAADVAGVHVLLIGTESVPTRQWPARKTIQAAAAAEAAKDAVEPAPDPDIAAADAVWHREHPTDCCPNWKTCTECTTEAVA